MLRGFVLAVEPARSRVCSSSLSTSAIGQHAWPRGIRGSRPRPVPCMGGGRELGVCGALCCGGGGCGDCYIPPSDKRLVKWDTRLRQNGEHEILAAAEENDRQWRCSTATSASCRRACSEKSSSLRYEADFSLHTHSRLSRRTRSAQRRAARRGEHAVTVVRKSNGQFAAGWRGGPGRPRGKRNYLSEIHCGRSAKTSSCTARLR